MFYVTEKILVTYIVVDKVYIVITVYSSVFNTGATEPPSKGVFIMITITIQNTKLRQFTVALTTVAGLDIGFKAVQDSACAEYKTLREVMEKYLHHAMNGWAIEEFGHPMGAPSLRNAEYIISVANAVEAYYTNVVEETTANDFRPDLMTIFKDCLRKH